MNRIDMGRPSLREKVFDQSAETGQCKWIGSWMYKELKTCTMIS